MVGRDGAFGILIGAAVGTLFVSAHGSAQDSTSLSCADVFYPLQGAPDLGHHRGQRVRRGGAFGERRGSLHRFSSAGAMGTAGGVELAARLRAIVPPGQVVRWVDRMTGTWREARTWRPRGRLPTAEAAQAAEAGKLARWVAEHRELRRN